MEVEPMTLLIRVVASHPHGGRPKQDNEMKWAQLPALLLRLSAGPPRTFSAAATSTLYFSVLQHTDLIPHGDNDSTHTETETSNNPMKINLLLQLVWLATKWQPARAPWVQGILSLDLLPKGPGRPAFGERGPFQRKSFLHRRLFPPRDLESNFATANCSSGPA